jgi:hypothetical protein
LSFAEASSDLDESVENRRDGKAIPSPTIIQRPPDRMRQHGRTSIKDHLFMNTNPYEIILANSQTPVQPVVAATLRCTDETPAAAADALSDEQYIAVGQYIERVTLVNGAEWHLLLGALMHLMRMAAKREDRREVLRIWQEELGISETKAYDAVAMYLHFGQILLCESQLCSYFPVESLKILSRTDVPEEARERAITLARRRIRVTAGEARAIAAEFGAELAKPKKATQGRRPPRPRSVRRRSLAQRAFEFTDAAFQLIVKGKKPKDNADIVSLIRLLEQAIDKLKKDLRHRDDDNIGPEMPAA